MIEVVIRVSCKLVCDYNKLVTNGFEPIKLVLQENCHGDRKRAINLVTTVSLSHAHDWLPPCFTLRLIGKWEMTVVQSYACASETAIDIFIALSIAITISVYDSLSPEVHSLRCTVAPPIIHF